MNTIAFAEYSAPDGVIDQIPVVGDQAIAV
jgi:hypothetical protein